MKVIKLLEYSKFLRQSYLNTFSTLPWGEFVKDRGGSFVSLRNIYLHCIEVLDRYVNYRILGMPEKPRIDFDGYDNMEKVKSYANQIESNVAGYLSEVTPEELVIIVELKFGDGTTAKVTVEDALFHLFQEEIHHIGEFIALLWQMNIEPPHLGWAKYISRQSS